MPAARGEPAHVPGGDLCGRGPDEQHRLRRRRVLAAAERIVVLRANPVHHDSGPWVQARLGVRRHLRRRHAPGRQAPAVRRVWPKVQRPDEDLGVDHHDDERDRYHQEDEWGDQKPDNPRATPAIATRTSLLTRTPLPPSARDTPIPTNC